VTEAVTWTDQTEVDKGFHNLKPEESRVRILKGGSWKNQSMVVMLPAGGTVPTKCALSWMNMGFPPNNPAHKVGAIGMEVGDAYSQALAQIIEHPILGACRFLLTIEHDNLPPPNGVTRLLAHMEANPHLSAISGLYWTKGPEGVPQIWGDPKDPILNFRPQPPAKDDPAWANELAPPSALVECCGTGMGFVLWRMAMFKDKRLRRPWFATKDGYTQDLYLWSDARKYGYRCAVACDVKVGHVDTEGTVW